jgi:hypothetical protein
MPPRPWNAPRFVASSCAPASPVALFQIGTLQGAPDDQFWCPRLESSLRHPPSDGSTQRFVFATCSRCPTVRGFGCHIWPPRNSQFKIIANGLNGNSGPKYSTARNDPMSTSNFVQKIS